MILGIVALYILFTSWLTMRLRSRTTGEFMNAARCMPAAVVGVLLMSEFIGAKSTIGTAQEAFQSGMAASWSVLARRSASCCSVFSSPGGSTAPANTRSPP